MTVLHTIGYGGVEWPAFLSALQKAHAQTVVDCRLVPYSKTMAEYSSEHLGCALLAMKIGYLSAPELGNPVRDACKAAGNLAPYVQHLQAHPEALLRLLDLLHQGIRVALLCGCVRSKDCHRTVIALEVQRRLPALELRPLHPRLGKAKSTPDPQRDQAAPPRLDTPAPAVPAAPRQAGDGIYGLTLMQPWPWAICEAGKRLENRSWAPWCPVGTHLAIHAGQRYDAAGAAWMTAWGLQVPPQEQHHRGIVAVARLVGVMEESDDVWFREGRYGRYGWVLDDVVVIVPVPCPGALNLWALPPTVLARVAQRYRKAAPAAGEMP